MENHTDINNTLFTKIGKLLVAKKINWNRKLGKSTQNNLEANRAEWNKKNGEVGWWGGQIGAGDSK